MKMSEFTYKLPEERIAKYPPEIRGTSNLLVLDKETGNIEHRKYFNIPEYIEEGDVVVLNETKVRKQRTNFIAPTGKRLEVMFLNQEEGNWFCLVKGGKRLKPDQILVHEEDDKYTLKVVRRKDAGFILAVNTGSLDELFKTYGHTPLPPYMKREDNEQDHIRYNTVFSQIEGSAASPTASLNLTDEILDEIEKRGAKIVKVELRVGWGTFAPVREENIEDHEIHEEYISISQESADIINKAKEEGKKVWAFGTTVSRNLESCVDEDRKVFEYNGPTRLYIYPGYEFKVVDHLITNFHMPDSSLILLVSAFAGVENIKKAYDEAIEKDYKFLSYGDSMLIL
jgi:S-adenosylmethionine:tRNA ribosyltransferase-isomerase